MSIEYHCEVAVGVVVDERSLAAITVVVPEKSHMEDRYDQNTGVLLPQVKVVDEVVRATFVIGEDTYDCFTDACLGLADYAQCNANIYENRYSGDHYGVFGPELQTSDDGVEDHPLFVNGSVLLSEVTESLKDVARIRQVLASLGIETAEPVVKIGVSVL